VPGILPGSLPGARGVSHGTGAVRGVGRAGLGRKMVVGGGFMGISPLGQAWASRRALQRRIRGYFCGTKEFWTQESESSLPVGHSFVQHSFVQHSFVQHSFVQHSFVQHSFVTLPLCLPPRALRLRVSLHWPPASAEQIGSLSYRVSVGLGGCKPPPRSRRHRVRRL
jgi:hypothetical protein